MALHLGRGVCQDFAHLLLCVLRLLAIPARYVSGQLLGEGVPHAWVECLVDGEVIAYDPTHGRCARLDYVTVAVGRDFADVTPTSGVFSGAATGVLGAAKTARVLTLHPQPSDTADDAAA
jgi:transglutaminase-like putative cysteine protease